MLACQLLQSSVYRPLSSNVVCAISCKAFPGHTGSVDVDSLHISYADIFISQVRAASGSPPQCQLTVEDVFWDATILLSPVHMADISVYSRI